MTIRRILTLISTCWLLALSTNIGFTQEQKPNIAILDIDDMNW
ncbi:hypothetical protein CA13_57570 [Planctomycetes bacterium CA13]|uniref:Uncharacterized protein n=1 Tax=Novipirellula herctigrandis TaxID=2527986 RepID=A0A5C5ZAP0_9BACT|nr:hypothetical protein CA13_57570 [Planctomycetes bacterium CA13]